MDVLLDFFQSRCARRWSVPDTGQGLCPLDWAVWCAEYLNVSMQKISSDLLGWALYEGPLSGPRMVPGDLL